MSSTSKITSRRTDAGTGSRAGAIAGAAAAASSRRCSVTFSGTCRSPLLLVAVAEEDRDGVHQQQREHHHEDRGGGKVDELAILVLGPCEDLDRQRGERGAEAVGVKARAHGGADDEQRRGLSD